MPNKILPKADEWSKAPLAPQKRTDAAELQTLLDRRREILRPECVMTGEEAVQKLQGSIIDSFVSPAGEMRVYFLVKPEGRLRMLCTSDNWQDDDEATRADILVRSIVERMADNSVSSIYWYIDDILQKTGDGRLFFRAAQIIDSKHAATLRIDAGGDQANIKWEVFRR